MFIEVMTKRLIAVKKEAQERIKRCEREGLCLACMEPILPKEETIRSVHKRCYSATYRAIVAGKTTWHDRQAAGRIGPPKAGRKPSNPVSAEFAS